MNPKRYFLMMALTCAAILGTCSSLYAQCSGYGFSGLSNVCRYSSYTYFAYGGNANCSASSVSGSGNTISGGVIYWGAVPGNYTVTYNCTCGTFTQSVTVNANPNQYTLSGGGTFCAGSTGPTITLNGSQTGVTYRLYAGSTLVATTAGTGSALTWTNLTTPGTYSATAGLGTCSATMSGSPVVTQNPSPVAPVTTESSRCGAGSVSLQATPGTNGNTIRWYSASSGGPLLYTGTTYNTPSISTTTTYYASTYNSTTGCESTRNPARATINVVPEVPIAEPVNRCGPGIVNLTATVGNGGDNILWYTSPNGTTPVASGSSYSPDISTSTTYYVSSESSSTGCESSRVTAAATINPIPTVYTTSGAGVYCTGATGLTITLSGSQIGVTYQLKVGASNVGSPVAGSGSGLSWTNQTAAGTYTVVATGVGGCVQTMSGSPVITVSAPPALFTFSGAGSNLCEGTQNFSLTGSETGVNYQLQRNGAALGAVKAGTGAALTWSNINALTGTFTVLATNTTSGCTRTMTGNPFVNALPTTYTLSGATTICPGGSVTLTLSGSQTGVNYQLLNGTTAVGAATAGTGSALSWTNVNTPGTYTVKATHATTTCFKTMTGSLNVVNGTAASVPTIFAVSGGGTICEVGSGATISLSGSQSGVSYQLKVDNVNAGAAKAGTGSALSWTGQTAQGSYTIIATMTSTLCTQQMSGAATISHNASADAYTVSGGGQYCSGGAGVNIGLSGSATGINYQLKVGSTNVGTAVAGTGAALSWTAIKTAGTYTVVATNPTTTCTKVMTGSAVVTVLSLPSAYTVSGTGYCSGSASGSTITLSGSQTGINYQLKLGSANVGSPAAGTGNALTWPNILTTGTYTVTATNASTGCLRNMTGSAVVSIFPLPTAYTVGGGGALCEGGAGAPITLSGSQTGVNYQLQLDGINTGSSVAGTGAAISFPAQISAGTYTVNATYASTGCTKTMTENAVITIKPVVVPTITGPAKLTGASITLSIATTTGHTYQWRRDGDNISGAATSWIAVTTTGSYDVVVTASNGCSRTTSAYQVTKDLTPYYNGNIAAVRWRTDKPYGSAEPDYTGMYTFTFDEEYQIKDATWATPDFVSNDFTYNGNKFRLSDLTYDANGNILSMRRYDKNGTRTNNFTYTYEPNKNKLQSVSGYVAAYGYDAIGQTTVVDKVEAGKDQYIDYDVSGKVIRVYGDPAKTPSSLKVENIYDERGLRIGKIDHVAQKTTWYMHDATGRVMNIFEQQGIAATNNVNPVVNTEVPIYGAFKIGAMYPQLEGSTDYEVADHLGNVRALVKDNVTIYTATMEDTEIPDITNPRVEEMAYFENLFETEQSDAFMNHSPAIPGIVDAPSMVAYLNWNDNTGTQAADRAVGPSIALEVKAGETITAEVWTRYEEKTSFTKDFGLVALSSLLGNTFVSLPGFENLTVAQASSNLAGALTAAGFPDDGVDGTRPFAYLNYIIYDANMVYQDAGWVRVTEEAGSQPAELYLPQNKPIRLSFDTPITIRENGFIYIWVSNQSKDTRVWFDDLKVSHHEPWVTQATDYGVWGDILRQQKTDSHFYRYAFQGDFSEKDPETGWNHFEAREYDPVTGRWLTMDPARQFPSPYAAFANNPIIRVDPDGKIIPLIAAYLIRRALIECGKRFIINAGLDALAQFSANVIKANDYSWDGMVNAFKDVDWGDAAAEGLSGTIKITGNSKTAKVMKVAIPVLTEFMKAGLDYKGLQDDPTFQKVRSVLVEKGYPSATVDLVAGLTSKLAGFLSEELGGGGAAKWVNETGAPFLADMVAEWIAGATTDVIEDK